MNISNLIENKPLIDIPNFKPGDTIKVGVKIIEGGKERIQYFQGIIIKIRRGVDGGGFTLRRISYGIGVERTFLFASPRIASIELIRKGIVRRAKLYYLRNRSGKAARIKERR
jgi:large subunit ribosomal protein L19